MEILLDMHTHTLASGHAYSTIAEVAAAAAEQGLCAVGITEHAPTMPGTCHNFYFQNLKVNSENDERYLCAVWCGIKYYRL